MTIWGGYPRISEDPKDLRTGMGRQEQDIIAGVTARGGKPGEIRWYRENDTSAYRKKKVTVTDPLGNSYVGYRVIRPLWHQALHDLRTGVIDALMVWDLDRLARDPRDLEDAIEVVVYNRGRIEASASSSRIDLTTDNGIAMARVMVAMGSKSSADTARRVKRMHQQLHADGKPVGGRRAFGWNADKLTLDPVESAHARAAIEAITKGATLSSIIRKWNQRGIRTVMGKEWTTSVLRQYLVNPRLAGVRVLDGVEAQGNWDPLLTREEFDRLQAVLVKPETRGRVPRRGARHYMLTGIVRCGVCNAPMYGNAFVNGFNYACHSTSKTNAHSLAISGRNADEIIEQLYLARMESEELGEGPGIGGPWPGEADLIAAQDQITELMGAFRAKVLSGQVVFPQVQELEAEVARMQKDRTAWLLETSGPVLSRVTRAEWDAKSAPEKNALLEQVFEAVLVRPSGGSKRFSPDRLVPVWRAGQPSPAAAPA